MYYLDYVCALQEVGLVRVIGPSPRDGSYAWVAVPPTPTKDKEILCISKDLACDAFKVGIFTALDTITRTCGMPNFNVGVTSFGQSFSGLWT